MAENALLTGREVAFQKSLAAWFRQFQRDLPWRRERSLYGTVVSEFMLQQTQVATVVPYYERWMQELPDFHSLAAASEDRVLKLWEGLGYYSRARNLHKLAKAVVKDGTPTDRAGWLAMPGVGRYASAAIGSIAQNLPSAVVDGNVVRILSRMTEDDRPFSSGSVAMKAFGELADQLLNRDEPGLHNEAMMELGATVCLKAKPLCLLCPVKDFCCAGRNGTAESYPKIGRPKTQQVQIDRLFCIRSDFLLLSRHHSSSRRLADAYELPRVEELYPRGVGSGAGLSLMAKKSRGISSQRIQESIYTLAPEIVSALVLPALPCGGINCAPTSDTNSLHWVPLSELDDVRMSGPHRRWITELLSAQS